MSGYYWGELRERLVGRRASFHHASLYLGCSPEVKVLLVEVFIVPVFILTVDVHRENMQTHRDYIDSRSKASNT